VIEREGKGRRGKGKVGEGRERKKENILQGSRSPV
jgi:hypothetical protein